jgi:deazaflavin-dependent oxidoreductase (nitroreductase family)
MDSRTLPSSAGQQGLSILQLHHVGAKSGSKRVTPLAYWPASDTSVAVLASNYGAARHPGWYHNLIALPSAVVEIDGDWWTVTARVAPPGGACAPHRSHRPLQRRGHYRHQQNVAPDSRRRPRARRPTAREAGTDSMTRSTSSRSAAGSR